MHALSLVSLVFGEAFVSSSLHDLFLHFLAKCFLTIRVQATGYPAPNTANSLARGQFVYFQLLYQFLSV